MRAVLSGLSEACVQFAQKYWEELKGQKLRAGSRLELQKYVAGLFLLSL